MTVVHLKQQPAAEPAESGPRIWAIASGKGGVGKSVIASSLGLSLARHGKRTVLVDLDLGGANLHTCLGMPSPRQTLSDFIAGKRQINEFVQPSTQNGLGLISGATDGLEIANLKHFQKQKIIRNLKHIEADYVILDLGAGTTLNTIDFFIQAERGIISVVPDPTSIENTYRFLKCVLTRRLREAPTQTRRLMLRVLNTREGEERKIRTIAAFMHAMQQLHPEHARLLEGELARQELHLIVNQVLEPIDTELGPAISMVCQRYFGRPLDYLGYLNHDRQVVASMRQRQPFLTSHPQSRTAIHLEHMAAALLDRDQRHEGTATNGDRQRDYYALLELRRDASNMDIINAYRQAKLTYKSDSLATLSLFDRQELERIRTEIEEAYRTLSNPERRQAYNAELASRPKQQEP